MRKGKNPDKVLVCLFNMTPLPRENYRIGVPFKGRLREIFNSDASDYSGTGDYHNKGLKVSDEGWNGKSHSAIVKIAPLAGVVFELNAS